MVNTFVKEKGHSYLLVLKVERPGLFFFNILWEVPMLLGYSELGNRSLAQALTGGMMKRAG